MTIIIGYVLNLVAFWFLNEGKDELGFGIGRKIIFFILLFFPFCLFSVVLLWLLFVMIRNFFE